MRAPSNKIAGVSIVVVSLVLGIVLMLNSAEPEPEVRKAPSRATIERELRAGETLTGPADAPFALRYTDDWQEMDAGELGTVEPQPAAGLRRTDDSGLLTVSVRGGVRGGLAALRRTLPAELARRFDDFRLIAIRPVEVAAGQALYVSFEREASGQIQTRLVVPESAERSYQVDTVLRPEARDTAAQVGVMLGTFAPGAR